MNRLGYVLALLLSFAGAVHGQGPALQEQLTAEGAASLAAAARREGDPQRGAIVFHQPFLACTKCHAVGQAPGTPLVGPDLTRPEPGVTAQALIESILDPSKSIRQGFESVIVQLTDGTTVTGRRIDEAGDQLVLADSVRLGATVTIPRNQIEERVTSRTSAMPAGQVNVLASRQQFLDLARYLIEIAEQGPERARQLQPPPSLFTFVLPEYEKQVDHAGMLRDLDDKAFQRGEAIYQRLCINCHGTKDQPGSLPMSLRFAAGKFKNGPDPFRMYQTLTHGFGLMTPQTWMVPQQKYDVIHYIREAYLKPDNPSQYVSLDNAYLATLPAGTTRGPAPSTVEPWSQMNYGPFLAATYEVGETGSNFAHKGIATRLDPGPGGVSRGKHWQLFDHDTLRLAAAWRAHGSGASPNFIDWHGINFDGRHQSHPRLAGMVELANPTGPGWGHPETGSFDDPRIPGRDGKRYGPLPRNWGRYRGLYQHGDQVILSYTVGSTRVLEMPGVVAGAGADPAAAAATRAPIFTRTFQIGSRSVPMRLKVATHPAGPAKLELVQLPGNPAGAGGTVAMLAPASTPAAAAAPAPMFGGTAHIAIQKSADFDLTDKDYTITARIKTRKGGTILSQAPASGPWAPDGKTLFVRGGRLTFDIGWVGAVAGKSNIADDRWHDLAMTWQQESGRVRLFVDGKLDGQGTLKPKAKAGQQTIRLGFTSPDFPDPTFLTGQIADVRFFQRSLSAEDLATINTPVHNASKGTPPPVAEGLLAHWKVDAITDTVRDETGRGHGGTFVSGSGTAAASEATSRIVAGLSPMLDGAIWQAGPGGSLILVLPAGADPLQFVLSTTTLPQDPADPARLVSLATQPPLDLASLTKGGPRRWLDELSTPIVVGPDQGPFAVDVLSVPASNPWWAQLRLTGLDFYDDGDRLAACSWDGDVWLVSGLKNNRDGASTLRWRRIANGLFQPLGLKIVQGQIHVACRDQIAILRDLNQDGETDFVECFNSDHQVTEHFHEFAMGLQTDAEGNFYYAKSARHALPAVVPQHGTLLRVSRDGSRTDIVANGFRAANGVCLNPDGSFVVTDQEGHWNPKNRINWVTPAGPGERPRFYGNLFGYHDVTDPSDSLMEPPLCWITNAFDRSPAELLWVTSDAWGPLKGSLLNLSYGYGKLFVVPFETLERPPGASANAPVPRVQGGMCELPLPLFPTGIMRGRFHPGDGQLYACGMFAWAGNATQPGGLYRIRATGRPMHLPVGLAARPTGMQITFTGDLDPATAVDPGRYVVRTWSLKRSADYGSRHHDEKTLPVTAARLSDDRRTLFLELPDIRPTWCMSIEYRLTGSGGEPVNGLIHNTIHQLGK